MKSNNGLMNAVLKRYHEDVSRCVKCGSCAAACPTYAFTRDESYSARGRMALVKAVLDGRLAVSALFKDRLATCVSCLACEASCPSNVPVTEIIRAAKEQVVAESGRGMVDSVIAVALKQPALFRAAAWLAPAVLHYRTTSFPGVTGKRLRRAESGARSDKPRGAHGRVAFFPGCAVEHFIDDIGEATIGVLNALGYDVTVPKGIKCCGRPLLSLGDRRAAQEQALHNAAVLQALEVDAIVTACASCGLTFKKEYPRLLPPGMKSPQVQDIHEFLLHRLDGMSLGPVRKNITIHDPCHLGRGQGLARTVRELLLGIPGITLMEMKDPDRCCGFGGVMRIAHHGLSDGIAGAKVRTIRATGAELVATGCPGCRMQIAEALSRCDSDITVVHPMQLLELSLAGAMSDGRAEAGVEVSGSNRKAAV